MFDELLAEHLALQASRVVRSKKLSEAQKTLEEALAAFVRVSRIQEQKIAVAVERLAEDR